MATNNAKQAKACTTNVDPLREQLVSALRGTDTGHPLRLAMKALLAEGAALETRQCAAQGLTMEQGQFQRGRLAAMLDLSELWAELEIEAQREAEE